MTDPRIRDGLHQIVEIYCQAGKEEVLPGVIQLYLADGVEGHTTDSAETAPAVEVP